ncbi:RagB/SusD family nutrient uptake outer membrane protein [Hymenobacter sp. ASUV-10]|uniref:RagB/SusD family nutrient uptake outer membrane protein n=1 Tax=Hymenobacter aranciens TaxID=3063996 RepID=A0ABT9BER0_9BACT|nr:RagB/SusD family nutrient uptake outer membrane protein [Hymenobacter sp. ASUV-10]MDO7876722.1 RagB/SusD family nutrient uptake outer membrane protein [Hymenobacter sp. ASUV-10]
MKKLFLLTLGLSAMLTLTGCEKDILDEQPESVLVPSFLSTPQGLEAGLTGSYAGLRTYYGSSEETIFMCVAGTDEFTTGIFSPSGLDDYATGLLIPTAAAPTNVWGNLYRYVNNVNGVIQYAASVQGLSTARIEQIKAEAKVLRAQYYFLLVQTYGDVPLMLKFVDAPTKDVVRAPQAEVYQAIIQDLTDALGAIADKPAQPGRVTRATALHLLAKVHLTRATHPAKQATDYADAAKFAKELIDNQTRYSVGLDALSAVHREGNENGKEVLMNVQFNGDATFTQTDPFNYTGTNLFGWMWGSRYDLLPNMVRDIPNMRPYARFCPTEYLLNSFVMPGESGPTLRSTDARFGTWWTTTYFVNRPGNNGGSTAAVVGDTSVWYPGYELSAARLAQIAARRPAPFRAIPPSQYTREFYPRMKKYDCLNRSAVNSPSTRPFIVYRLAETYLIAAEAFYYLGNTDQARDYINVIRERAAAPGKAADMRITAAALTPTFFLEERTRELTGEMVRWFDLKRTGTLVSRVRSLSPAVASRTYGVYGSAAAANIQDFHTLRPIPQQEVDRSSGKITQNMGYN